MNLQDVLDVLHRRPFAPFRVFVSDGSSYDVCLPEFCMPALNHIVIGVGHHRFGIIDSPEAAVPVADHFITIHLIDITRLEPLDDQGKE